MSYQLMLLLYLHISLIILSVYLIDRNNNFDKWINSVIRTLIIIILPYTVIALYWARRHKVRKIRKTCIRCQKQYTGAPQSKKCTRCR